MKKKRRNRIELIFAACFALYFIIIAVVQYNGMPAIIEHYESIGTTTSNCKENNNKNDDAPFVPTLRGKKILFEVTTVGQFQYSYTEDLLDSVRDLCEAGARVSLHITTSNCKPGHDPDCPLYERSWEDDPSTKENNYSVEKLNQLNERLRCRNPEGSLEAQVHLISPMWGKQVVNHHRRIFCQQNVSDYDVFVHTEEDALIRPTNILAFMDETEKLRRRVGNERLPDYCIGFMRYENEIERWDKRRVVWEFNWNHEVQDTIDHPGIEGLYFTTPDWHHQGMYMAVPDQLLAWKDRKPECQFDKPTEQYGYHRERISGGINLFSEDYCNVTQLIPLDSAEDFLIHHLPNKNHKRVPAKTTGTMDLHKRRMKVLSNQHKKLWVDAHGNYNGIQMLEDEPDSSKSMPYNLTAYHDYVARGGMLSNEELKESKREEEE